MKKYFELFLTFAKIGVCTFGGGLAMLPMLKYELVEKHGWIDEDQLLDYYAVGQCTPGIIAVNTATFVGYDQAGVLGGIIATLGMVFPSIVIISLVAALLSGFMSNVYVGYALAGIRAAVCALLANTCITLAKKSLVDIYSVIVYLLVIAVSFIFSVPSILIVIFSAVVGAIYALKRRKFE